MKRYLQFLPYFSAFIQKRKQRLWGIIAIISDTNWIWIQPDIKYTWHFDMYIAGLKAPGNKATIPLLKDATDL